MRQEKRFKMRLKGYAVKTAGGMYVYKDKIWDTTRLCEFPELFLTLEEAIKIQKRDGEPLTKIVYFDLEETDVPERDFTK